MSNILKKSNTPELIEKIIYAIFLTIGMISVTSVLVITVYLFISGIPAIREIGILDFLLGEKWVSTGESPLFGILPFILTSFYGTAIAILIGTPIGILTAVYVAKLSNRRLKTIVDESVGVLAGIPSVVYGLIGMLVLVPSIKNLFNLSDGACLLAASIVLATMILPSIIKVTITALDSIPEEFETSSLALGATKIETLFKVQIPAARSGIVAAIVLGIGRAIGEAMAVMMVSGNVPNMPGMFESVRFLTTAVASEMAYSQGLQREALFSIALVLFLFIMAINISLGIFLKKSKEI